MSSDGVSVAIHEFGGDGPPLLFSHATGFHGFCYLPIADRLDERFTCFALDYRGHGSTPRPAGLADEDPSWTLDWAGYGDDAEAVATAIAPDGGLTGFGHSMGAAALLMAAHRRPDLFELIIAFEPIVFPGPRDPDSVDGPPPIIERARRRRPSFASFEEARANYGSKPPLGALDPDALRLYVAHGFRPAPEGVRLTCSSEWEARTFEGGAVHRTWDILPEIETPVVVIGSGDEQGPAVVAQPVAEHLANGRFVHLADTTHFGPLSDPGSTARLIAELAA